MFLYDINECSSASLALIMQVIKKTMSIIGIIVPILLIISLTLNVIKLMKDPDDKKIRSKIKNSLNAAVLVFFVPIIVNAAFGMLSNNYNFSACWNETVEHNYKTASYIEPNASSSGKVSIIADPNDYEKGEKKPSPSPSSSSGGSDGGGASDGGNQITGTDGLSTTPSYVSGDVEVHFINPNSRVDAIYIKAGNQSMFIDGGFKSDGKREIAYLEKIGVKRIDYYLGTHSHKNHVEAAPAIIAKYGIKKVLVGRETCSGSGSTACSWYAIQGFASQQKVSLSGVTANVLYPGNVFYLGPLKITCLGPIEVTNGLGTGETKQNYNSLVLRLDYGSTSFMLTGDNSAASTIKKINSTYPGMLNVDVLKNAHHNGCTSDEVYKMYNAEYVVFTTRYDYLPSNDCINRIKKYGAKKYFIVANGYSGNVVFTSDGTNIKAYDHYKD